ncbi:peptidoglycan recognition protein family protein [Schinkia azotoformans]|uniref:peptidoglycan recognition protein family protein n=1 Tax=Schinkia azotoformans TaxID=1454 RepID=UPI00389AA947
MKMKKIFVVGLILLSYIFIYTDHANAAGNNPGNLYYVKSGDSLEEIAVKFDTTVGDIKATNGLQTNLLFIGQKLKVPANYEVVAGDSLQKIAIAFNTTVETIKITNGLSSDALTVGQKMKISPKRMSIEGQHILMTREEFKEWLLNHKFSRKVNLIQQHHTWSPSYKHFKGGNHFSLLKGMENYHRQTMKWNNIAQNITTFPDGKIAVSRPFNVAPEGTIGWGANHAGIMIEHVGNFDQGFDVMTKEQKETIVYITALLCIKFGLTPSVDTITYHRWWDLRTGNRVLDNSQGAAVKTCPGTAFFGGNTTKSATQYFYPLVSNKMNEIWKQQ